MRAETLERRLSKLRQMYFEGMDRRVSDYNTIGYVKDDKFSKWEGRLSHKIDLLRKELAQTMPEKYHYGKENKHHALSKKNTRFSKHGDNGLIICEKCKGLFEWSYKNSRLRFIDNFRCCSEHAGMKNLGTMMINKEMLCDC